MRIQCKHKMFSKSCANDWNYPHTLFFSSTPQTHRAKERCLEWYKNYIRSECHRWNDRHIVDTLRQFSVRLALSTRVLRICVFMCEYAHTLVNMSRKPVKYGIIALKRKIIAIKQRMAKINRHYHTLFALDKIPHFSFQIEFIH